MSHGFLRGQSVAETFFNHRHPPPPPLPEGQYFVWVNTLFLMDYIYWYYRYYYFSAA